DSDPTAAHRADEEKRNRAEPGRQRGCERRQRDLDDVCAHPRVLPPRAASATRLARRFRHCLEEQRQRRAGLNRARRVAGGLSGNRLWIDDREAPLVELDSLGEELRAEPVALARDWIHAHALHQVIAGIGRTRRLASQRPRRWSTASRANTSSALVANPAAPSGCRHAPRPRTS